MNIRTLFKILSCAIVAPLLVSVTVGQSVPNLINYQGKLTDQAGAPLPGGSYGIQFRLWDSPTASDTNDLIWDQQQIVTVQTNGVFNVILGSSGGTTIPGTSPAVNNLAYAFPGSNCFLGVTVTASNGVTLLSPGEILPRQQFLSVPYAVQSMQAQQALIASSLVSNLANALCPAGSIIAFGATNTPSGWLLCDGSAYSSIQYPFLYSAITTNWGAGTSGTTNNLNVPDLRGLFLRGFDLTGTNDPDYLFRTNRAGIAGPRVGSFQLDAIKSHIHTIQGGFFNGFGGGGGSGYGGAGSGGQTQNNPDGRPETRPKNAYVNYIIKY